MPIQPSRRDLLNAAAALGVAMSLPAAAETAHANPKPARTGGAYLKVGCCAYSYRQYLQAKSNPMTLFEFLDLCAGMNLDGVELTSYYFPDPLTPEFLNKLTRHAFLLGLEVGGSATNCNFCVPKGEQRDKELAHIRKWLDYSRDMGSRAMRIFAGGAPKGTTNDEARKWVVECIEELLPHAEKCGVMLALENHGGVVSDADGTLAIANALNSEWFGLKWDCGNYRTADPYADLQRTVPYAVTTHIKTDIYPSNKKTDTDLTRVVKILKDANYRGYLHLEYEATEEPKTAIPRILAGLQKLAQSTKPT